ncbi:hypothetical protein COCNU_10G008110 [Cocos nucifera]|uniref:Uncharacterized protein n=1 Tax=Cocos nucifera TaxID=13894 RepID=A0A8K0N8L1_COCNU|nr:hypothetical protein COCNU_10G008110 [Cocos nucifera]
MTADIGFVIEAELAVAIMDEWGVATAPELLVALVPAPLRLATPPNSYFPIGAGGLGMSGRIYVRVNMEFPGLPLHHSTHVEQFLVTNAAVNSEIRIRCIAVSLASTTAAGSSSPPTAPHPHSSPFPPFPAPPAPRSPPQRPSPLSRAP